MTSSTDTSSQAPKAELRQSIEEFYLPRQLIQAIQELGGIPEGSVEDIVGIGFVDIVDYSQISQLLSPKENQDILNGLYSAFNEVLRRHGGFLNKIEGDSLMFHFGGTTDPDIRNLPRDEKTKVITRKLFYACVEMQRVCNLFNQIRPFLKAESVNPEAKADVEKAYRVLKALREQETLGDAFNAFFQLRIRAGANVGDVIIGNFGPRGAKRWDVIGHPVVKAKRMESSAPVGGLRISSEFFHLLQKTGIATDYAARFRREAGFMGSRYQGITDEELYRYGQVVIHEKKGAAFETYSVQVNPNLPEDMAKQADLLLHKGERGIQSLIKLVEYSRGNRHVIEALEAYFNKSGVDLHLNLLVSLLKKGCKELDQAVPDIPEDLYSLLEQLGELQDFVKRGQFSATEGNHLFDETAKGIFDFDQFFKTSRRVYREKFMELRRPVVHRTYFYNFLYPMVWKILEGSFREYQNSYADLELL